MIVDHFWDLIECARAGVDSSANMDQVTFECEEMARRYPRLSEMFA